MLRPLVSCALWRLHESIERNDANQLFLLSDQTEVRSVAQKLNIMVRSCEEVAATIESNTSKIRLDTFGDLERDFGVQQKSVISPIKDAEEPNEENGAPENTSEDLLNDEDVMNNSISSEGTANTDASSIVHEQDLEKQVTEPGENKSSVNGDSGEHKVKEQGFMVEMTATLAPENIPKKPAKPVESITSIVDSIMKHDSEKHLSKSVNGLKAEFVKSKGDITNQPASEHSSMRSPPETTLPQPRNMEPVQRVQDLQAISDTNPSTHTSTSSTKTLEPAQEPEDSDEEVVVFIPQPKRLSAQQKLAQRSSRPSTPKEQIQQKPAGQSPQKAPVKTQSKGKLARHSPATSNVGQAHPQPLNSPTVIDPDAFGRDFRVNPNPGPRPPHNPYGHSHRNRGNMQTAQTVQVPRNSPRQPARTSPPRNAPQENSRRLTPIPGPASKDATNHRRQVSRTSPQRPPAPKSEEVTLIGGGFNAPSAVVLSEPQLPESRMVEPNEFVPQSIFSPTQLEHHQIEPGTYEHTDFVPRSALPNTQSKPNTSQPRVYDASEFVPRPPRPVREFKPRAPKPKVFEPTEFVPRDFVPRMTIPRSPNKPCSPEPESIEPRPSINDVDYVLKSGSTRASARGRGRLWTPS